ncbi:hypothetical protein RvY_10587 [Ramazzottius varieornatus]|uniref:Uncharacterized protein n=1 Tax=Ramazzottius varieornatus TaxID=947166 RepID=A0A1D1VDA0_RAMVA|nr:hypothetical protein RvY_10587 [Ramazzottius varieornatus]
MEHGEDAVPVWSTVAAPDRTQICPAQKFFVSVEVLEHLQLAFGPGKALPESCRETNWQRYGWELIREIIGEDKLVASKKRKPGIGIAKLLNSLTDSDTDILSAVLCKWRKSFMSFSLTQEVEARQASSTTLFS